MLSQISKLSIFLVAEPILNSSFDVYTGKETVDNSSVPLLCHVEPPMSEQYLRAIVRLISPTTTHHTDLLCRRRHLEMSDEIVTQSLSEMDIINKCTTKLSYAAGLEMCLYESSVLYVKGSFVK